MQALQYEVVLGNALGRLCGTGRTLCKSCSAQDEFGLQGTKMPKERDGRMRNGLETKEMSRQKVSKETVLKERGLKIKV